jgi:hypothetical protein
MKQCQATSLISPSQKIMHGCTISPKSDHVASR